MTYERRLVAMVGTPDADLIAAEYRAAHPDGPFSQFLPLLEAHRWLCAASASSARLVRIGATELQARGTCINVSRE